MTQFEDSDIPAQGQDDASEYQRVVRIPHKLQIGLAVALLVPLIWTIWVTASYVARHPDTPPQDLRLPEMALVCLALLFLVVIPWDRFGLTIKKIGWLEFERVVLGQKKESADLMVALEERVAQLEALQRNTQLPIQPISEQPPLPLPESVISKHIPTSSEVQTGQANVQLRALLLKFLAQYDRWYFSAARIRKWGGQQPGYEALNDYPTALIAQELQRLLSVRRLRYKISSSSGSTLYRSL